MEVFNIMKQKFIPLEKQSKQKQKEFNAKQRRDWGSLNPITRKTDNAKVYNRKKSKQRWSEHEPCLDFLIYFHEATHSTASQINLPISLVPTTYAFSDKISSVRASEDKTSATAFSIAEAS